MSRSLHGLDAILGAYAPGKTYLVLHIENPQGLVEHEKGKGIAWATNLLVPEFIEKTIYEHVRDDMVTQFREKGSEVTIDLVQTPPKGDKPASDFGGGVIVGVLLALLGLGAVKVAGRAGRGH